MSLQDLIDNTTALFKDAQKMHDVEAMEIHHRQISELEHVRNRMASEESAEEMDRGIMDMMGLDPIQIEYAQKIAEERAIRKQNEMLAMQNMILSTGTIPPGALTAGPGSIVGPMTGTAAGNTITWKTYAKPMAIFKEPSQADIDADKRRHLKLFVHFAKEFVARYPKWTLVPDEKDPLHSVHLLMKERGAMIHNLYPSNEMAVYGGPASWVDPRKELGQALPIVKINTQEFWGWCVGMDDVPEWMI